MIMYLLTDDIPQKIETIIVIIFWKTYINIILLVITRKMKDYTEVKGKYTYAYNMIWQMLKRYPTVNEDN